MLKFKVHYYFHKEDLEFNQDPIRVEIAINGIPTKTYEGQCAEQQGDAYLSGYLKAREDTTASSGFEIDYYHVTDGADI